MRFYDFLGFEDFDFSDFYKEAQGFDVLAVLCFMECEFLGEFIQGFGG